MNAFEEIVAGLLWQEGYWTNIGYKVYLSKTQKIDLGKPSLPRPEIDILAYRANDNSLLWVECKSYLDSRGVTINSLTGKDERNAERFKVFTQQSYRRIVTAELVKQVVSTGLARPNPSIRYCLVTGRIATKVDREKLHEHFVNNGWILYDESWLKCGLEKLSVSGYEDDVAIIVAKLFARIESPEI
jgi:hypothetical protein